MQAAADTIEVNPAFLAVYHDGDAWVVATNSDDALLVWAQAQGDATEGYESENWERQADDEVLTLDPRDGGPPRTLRMTEWVQECGRGFLGSVSYL